MKKKKKAATTAKTQPPPPEQQPIPSLISITNVQEFQAAYGNDWVGIVRHPAFQAAMLFLNKEKLDGITSLDNEKIETHAKVILADLRGHLKLETDLFTLHTQQEFTIRTEQERFVKPEDAIMLEEQFGGKQ